MSAFVRCLRVFPVSAVLLHGILAGMAGSVSDSASGQERPVTVSKVSSATSVHDDKRGTNAVLQHSMSKARPHGDIQRGWTAAHGKTPSRGRDVGSLQSSNAGQGSSVANNRRPKSVLPSASRPIFMVSAGRPAIPPVPEPVRENAPPEDLDAVELSPVEPTPALNQSAAESSIPALPALEPSASEAIPEQQPDANRMSLPTAKPSAQSQELSDGPVLTATERFKLALEEERRRVLAKQAAANEETPELLSLDGSSIDLAPVEDRPSEQLPSPYEPQELSEIPVDDPETRLLVERDRRFTRLKQQLMQLKSQLEQPEATDASEPQPLTADEKHLDPQQNHSASDQDSGHEGHSEELLPPVDGHEARDSMHPETTNHAPEHGDSDASAHDGSAHTDSSGAVPEHSETPHGHDPVEHEPAVDAHSDSHAGERSVNEDNHPAYNSHAESGVEKHAAADGAAHVASEHAVVHGTIDRLGLANNLYAVGEYELALNMYEETDMAELTAQQQIWSDYQMANCLRRMGRNAEASNRYRRIAEQPEAGWLSDQSRWWVDVLEHIRQLQSSLEEDAGNSEEKHQSPFSDVPSDSKSSGVNAGHSESTKSGSVKSRSTKSGHGDQSSGGSKEAEHGPAAASSSSQTSSRAGKPSKERITHFAPAEKEPKHGEH